MLWCIRSHLGYLFIYLLAIVHYSNLNLVFCFVLFNLFFFKFSQGSSTSDCMSKTLDSASAHFAASAVVSAPAPGRSEVTKEQNTSHNNINGVVQPSGDDFLQLVV